jgi:dienelactone hydrolase
MKISPLLVQFILLLTCSVVSWAQTECNPAKHQVAKLIEIRPGYHRVEGSLAEFDPCHSSVNLSFPGFFAKKLAEKPPLLIIAHGGNGPGKAEFEMVRRMNAQGVATLLFDAYRMNGFEYQGTSLFLTGTTNESRQRMILKTTVGAYDWARKLNQIDNTRIFINGLSNGGSVALNMAAIVDPAHVKAVFAEGASPTGVGMPDKIKTPLYLMFGKLDNYGGKTEDDWMYSRRDPCSYNQTSPYAALGTANQCNSRTNPNELTISPQQWGQALQTQGQPVEFWFYENAAHGILIGYLDRGTRTYGSGATANFRYGWTGSDLNAPDLLIKDMIKVIKMTY